MKRPNNHGKTLVILWPVGGLARIVLSVITQNVILLNNRYGQESSIQQTLTEIKVGLQALLIDICAVILESIITIAMRTVPYALMQIEQTLNHQSLMGWLPLKTSHMS